MKHNHQVSRLITVTRGDLTPGRILAQTGHAISQFCLDHPDQSRKWNNNYLINLAVDSQEKLQKLLLKLHEKDVPLSFFTEPDFGNELTSICFVENDDTRRLTSHLPLAFKNFNNQ